MANLLPSTTSLRHTGKPQGCPGNAAARNPLPLFCCRACRQTAGVVSAQE
jgi:hypothetical protein